MTETINKSTEEQKIYNKKSVLIAIFLLFLIMRLIYLDADPSFIKRVSDIGDEGIWVHNARTLFLFNDIAPDDATQSLSVSPLNTLVMIPSFYLFGVSSFSARLPSAIAGWFTLLILYFFLKKAWGEKAAFMGLLLLGLNETFLIYNKIALGLSLESMFVLLSFFFWYKGKEKQYFYFLAGISFALAILSKLSAYYFALIFVIIWLLELYRKETNVSSIFIFGIGIVLPLIPYSLFLLSNWKILSINFLVLMKYYNSSGIIIFNFFRIFANNLFGLPGFFFMIVFTTIYFLTENKFKKIRSLDTLELMACCWLLVGLLLLVALSDLSDRRFFGLLIPMTILSTKLFLDKKSIDLDNQEQSQYHPAKYWRKNALYSLLFSYPVTSFIVSGLSLSLCSPISVCNSKQAYMLGLFVIIFSITMLILTYTKEKINIYFRTLFLQSSIFLFLLLPFSTLTRHFARHFAILSSTLNKETTYIITTIAISIILFVIYHIYSLYIHRLNQIKQTDLKKIFLIYFIICGILISITFIAPSFSAKESSQSLIPIIGNNKISGFLVQSLAFDASYLPILIYKEGSFEEVNKQYDMSQIKYIFKREIVDGKPATEPDDLLLLYESSHFIQRLYLYPYPFTNTSRIVVSIYEVNKYINNQT